MAERITVPPELRAKFGVLDEIATVTGTIKDAIDKINVDHKTAAGRDDKIAKEYHEKTDEPMHNLSTLVENIRKQLGLQAENGVTASNIFEQAGDNAAQQAKSL